VAASALLLVPPAGGCSLMFVDGPPALQYQHLHSSEPLPCTTSYAWPVVDVLWTAFQLVRFVSGISIDKDQLDDEKKSQLDLQIFGSVGFGLLAAISAGVGSSRVSDCRAVNADFLSPPPAPRAPSYRPPPRRPVPAAPPADSPPPADSSPPADSPPPAESAPPAPPAVDDEDPGRRRPAPARE
jgi:hypothetical protein